MQKLILEQIENNQNSEKFDRQTAKKSLVNLSDKCRDTADVHHRGADSLQSLYCNRIQDDA